jgi:hypothetical protein
LASVLRVVAVQSAMIVVFAGAILNGLGGGEWSLPLGVMLFFWNWERLMMYHIDHQDGLVPEDIPLDRYLGVFLSPGTIPNWNWGVTIGQGYAYVENNFLAEDKNHLIRKGLQLYGVALVYIVFGDWGHEWLVKFLRSQDLYVFHRVKNLSRYFANGGEVSTPTVLLTTFIDVFRWMVLWGGVVHFKVGTWLVCGYKCDPYFNRPWMATNLVTLWSRFTFHYREFLVRAFYYPAFFAMPKVARSVRIVLSTLAAATFGNFVWGHMSEAFFYKRIRFESLLDILPTWPYFVLIGVGISVSELWLLRKKRLWFQRAGSWLRSQRRRGSVMEGSARRLPEVAAWLRKSGLVARSVASVAARVSETSMARPRAEPSWAVQTRLQSEVVMVMALRALRMAGLAVASARTSRVRRRHSAGSCSMRSPSRNV